MTHICCVVPFYDVEEDWLRRCLDSIMAQQHPDFSLVMVDDASHNGAGVVAQGYEGGYRRMDQNYKAPYTIKQGIESSNTRAEDVILIVDGDDYLPHAGVLSRLAEVYEDPDVWLSWGSYTRWPDPTFMPNPATDYPEHVRASNTFRRWEYACFNHPISFRRHLWDQLTDADLQDDDGEWFRASYDAAIMYPLVELASNGHYRFLPDVLYVYNEANPASEAKTISTENGRVHSIVRGRGSYAPLP